MRKIEFPFSEKNIVHTNLWSYRRALLSEVEKFKERVRWRTFFHNKPELKSSNTKMTYGLKTPRSVESDQDLKEFERRLDEIVKNVTFKEVLPSKIQAQMKTALRNIKKEGMVVVRADKTSSYYAMNPSE